MIATTLTTVLTTTIIVMVMVNNNINSKVITIFVISSLQQPNHTEIQQNTTWLVEAQCEFI